MTEAAQCPKTAQDCPPNTAAPQQLPRDTGGDTPLPPPRSLIMRTWKLCNISFPPGPPASDSSETGQPRPRLHALPCEHRGVPALVWSCIFQKLWEATFSELKETVKRQWVPKASK